MHNVKVPHDDRCQDRIGEPMVEDDDQRQVERVLSRTVPEVESPHPEAGEEMDVGEPTVRVVGLVEDQPVPTVRVGGSSSSGTELDQVQEQMKRTQMIVKRNASETCQIHREPSPEEAKRGRGRTGSEGRRTTS